MASKWRTSAVAIVAFGALTLLASAAALADEGQGQASAARVSVVEGSVVVQHGSTGAQSAVTTGAPLTPGDYITTGKLSRAEVQFDPYTMLRLAGGVQAKIDSDDPFDHRIQLADGTIEFVVLQGGGGVTEVETPSVTVRAKEEGAYRVTIAPDGSTWVTARRGHAEIVTPNQTYPLETGKTLIASGAAAHPAISYTTAVAYDSFDQFNSTRDTAVLAGGYAVPGTYGYGYPAYSYPAWNYSLGFGWYPWAGYWGGGCFAPYGGIGYSTGWFSISIGYGFGCPGYGVAYAYPYYGWGYPWGWGWPGYYGSSWGPYWNGYGCCGGYAWNGYRPIVIHPVHPIVTPRRYVGYHPGPHGGGGIAPVHPIVLRPGAGGGVVTGRELARSGPVQTEPRARTPIDRTPIARTPIARTPIARTPIDRTPIARTPVARMPIARTPVARVPEPIARAPVEREPVAPVQRTEPARTDPWQRFDADRGTTIARETVASAPSQRGSESSGARTGERPGSGLPQGGSWGRFTHTRGNVVAPPAQIDRGPYGGMRGGYPGGMRGGYPGDMRGGYPGDMRGGYPGGWSSGPHGYPGDPRGGYPGGGVHAGGGGGMHAGGGGGGGMHAGGGRPPHR